MLWGTPLADKNGIWFVSSGDVYLIVPGYGTYYMGNIGHDGDVSGGCN